MVCGTNFRRGIPEIDLLQYTAQMIFKNWPSCPVCLQHGRAQLSADYCVRNTATRVRLRLQAACFDTYAGGWRLEEHEFTSQSPSSLRFYSLRWVVNPQLNYLLFKYLFIFICLKYLQFWLRNIIGESRYRSSCWFTSQDRITKWWKPFKFLTLNLLVQRQPFAQRFVKDGQFIERPNVLW